jgi:16S rRNA (uracil1498-N3)-methyltransferase
LREAAALVYVRDLEAPEPDEDDVHHLSAVLRLRPGELVIASDGAGGWRPCRVAGVVGPGSGVGSGSGVGVGVGPGSRASRGRRSPVPVLEPSGDVRRSPRAVPEITVGFSLAKGDRTEWAAMKLSELGVDRIVPLVCERTVARAPRAGRLERVAREAAMQARRVWLPEVLPPLVFAEAVALLGGSAPSPAGVAIAEPGGSPPSLASPVVLVGPEGGWSPGELAVGLPRVHLGPTILRIETAAVVAGALLAGLRSGVVGGGGCG